MNSVTSEATTYSRDASSMLVSTIISPEGSLEVLSQDEVNRLRDTSSNGLHDILRRCALAVLNCGSQTDDSVAVLNAHKNFEIEVLQQDRGIRLKLDNAPGDAFGDGPVDRVDQVVVHGAGPLSVREVDERLSKPG